MMFSQLQQYHWCYRLTVLWMLVVCLIGTGIPISAIAQEESPIQFDVNAGYDNRYRVNDWFPITVMIRNSGPDIRGTLEWQFPGQDNGDSFEREIDLPQGAQKRVMLRAFSNTFARTGRLRFVAEHNEINPVSQRVQLTPVEPQQFFVGVLSSDHALLSNLTAMPLSNSPEAIVAHLEPEFLPEEAITLSGINALFVHDIVTANLRPAQREALELWVRLGGQLIVGGGAAAERTTPGLTDLLPVEVLPLRSGVSLDSLVALVRGNVTNDLLAGVTANDVRLKPGARALDAQQLLTIHPVGDGHVIFCAFDLGALRTWSGEPRLWGRVLNEKARFLPALQQRQNGSNLLQSTLHLPELRLPSFGILILFIMIYIFLVGPLNYIILRRMGRAEWSWGTIPAIVVLFVAGTYSINVLVRGNQSQIMQVAVVQGFEGYERGQATDFVGIYSPNRRTYDVSFPPEALVSTNQFIRISDNPIRTVWADNTTDVRNMLIDVSSLRTLLVERSVAVPIQVASDLQHSANRFTGTVQNIGNQPLIDALVVSGTSAQVVGTIAPGATSTVDLNSSLENFPRQIDQEPVGSFSREEMLNMLFGPGQFVNFTGVNPDPGWGMVNSDGVYLLAWQPQPSVETRLDHTTRSQEGLTLYVIRLEAVNN